MRGIKAILRCFELVSGLRVNLGKNIITGVGVEEVVVMLLVELGCGVGRIHFTYLGLLVGVNPRSSHLESSN